MANNSLRNLTYSVAKIYLQCFLNHKTCLHLFPLMYKSLTCQFACIYGSLRSLMQFRKLDMAHCSYYQQEKIMSTCICGHDIKWHWMDMHHQRRCVNHISKSDACPCLKYVGEEKIKSTTVHQHSGLIHTYYCFLVKLKILRVNNCGLLNCISKIT